ncbi:methylenetetrahydrofolate reductase 1 [Aricia agestis]|uniref:methylenetetrahydrofolate reductase 1 n=1 Tax=Aricia agestis TaxID=91739 RepID=UPI001C2024CC|nr:methylenetetrahydrofolate reductase 1 [Aricia agestis]
MSRKIIELLNDEQLSYSIEVTQEITEDEINKLVINKIVPLEPLFYSVTWHALVHKCKALDIAPIRVAKRLRELNKDVLLHLTCSLLTKPFLEKLLETLQISDIRNLFIVLGENCDSESTDFKGTKDLIKYIRQITGDYFCIGVAGFPGSDDKLLALKDKVDSGADFILTQAFFEYEDFKNFLVKCKSLGINIPVIPGMFPFDTESELIKFKNLCKVNVSENFLKLANEESGIILVEKLINIMVKEANVKHYHFFTLNKIARIENLIKKLCSVQGLKL